jgi:two-component system alkaline phosphatase synthesis response regulator PhoP
MAYKILVVDDEPTIVRLMEFILARQGHEMLVAVNGEEALEKIRVHAPDLVLLDIMMPRIDGYEVARAVRNDPATAALPIIMLSAKAQEEDIRKGVEIGVDEYITKPFSPEHLVHVVAGYLGRLNKDDGKLNKDGTKDGTQEG